jgi:hypothetical protein
MLKGNKVGAMALFVFGLIILSCDFGLAWDSITENAIVPWFVGPSHQYIDEQAYKNLEKDSAFAAVSDKFPKMNQILANEGAGVSGDLSNLKISGPGPDSQNNSLYSYHEYNPRNQEGNAPRMAALYYDSMENGLMNGDNISKDAAYLAHYVADVSSPFHINGMYSNEALKLPRSGNLLLGKDVIGYCLPVSNVGMGCPKYPLSYNNILPPRFKDLQLRGSRGMNCTNWTHELNNWIPLNKSLNYEDWFDPWFEDGIALSEIGSTHLWWEYFAWANFSKSEYLVDNYSTGYICTYGSGDKHNIEEFVKRIAYTTSKNQKALLDESTQIGEYNSSSALAQAYYRAITDVYTAWRATFSAIQPSICVENNSKTGDKMLTVKIKNLATEPVENVWCKLEIIGAPGTCLEGLEGKYYCGEIPAQGEAVIDNCWSVKSTEGYTEETAVSLDVRGTYKNTPDSGRAYLIRNL